MAERAPLEIGARARAAALLLGLASACHATIELDPSDDGGSDAPSCGPAGTRCSNDADCCVGRCGSSGLCGAAACAVSGMHCTGAADCCTASCVGGACAPSAGGCAPTGETCAISNDCCSRVCAADGSGRVTCQALGGCKVTGELCRGDAECCNTEAGACVLIDELSGLGMCRASTSTCALAGEICRVAGDATATRDCCPGGPAGHPLCHPSGVGNLDRCVTQPAGSMACLADGQPCATPTECCSDICVLATGMSLHCEPSCSAEGQACTRSADCCDGECDESGACHGAARGCLALGSSCTGDALCCSAYCATTTATCSSSLF